MNTYQEFNEIIKELFNSTQVSFSQKNVPYFLVGADDSIAQKQFFVRPEILSIYPSSIKSIFEHISITDNIFNNDKLKVGFSKLSLIRLSNKITEFKNDEIIKYFTDNLPLLSDTKTLLWDCDKLSDTSLELILQTQETKSQDNLDDRFLKYLFSRINKSTIDLSDSLLKFLQPYSKDFDNIETKSLVFNFINKKYPKKTNIYQQFLNCNKKNKELITISTNLISVKVNKEKLYNTFSDELIINTEHYFYSLSKIEEFFNTEKKQLGINYCVFFGIMNIDKDFNLIIETNSKFKLSPESFAETIPQLLSLFFDDKNKELSELSVTNAHKIFEYYSLSDSLKATTKSSIKLKI